MPIPEDNQLTEDRVALGKQLFYDMRLSRQSDVSCASCHLQERAFADQNILSIGTQERVGFRNVPSLANIGYHPYLFREGGGISLETQVLGPLEAEDEMDFNMVEAVERLSQFPDYQEQAQTAYGRPFSAFVLSRALAAFQRTLISGNSAFDQDQRGELALSEAAARGLQLFTSEKTNCQNCHDGFDFSNYAFENNGLYEQYNDTGRSRVTFQDSDIGKFKVPSLRNVALTPPYMHDGSLSDLESVIEHYNTGGKAHVNKSSLIRPLGLSDDEKSDLIEFLKSLSDNCFISNPDFAIE